MKIVHLWKKDDVERIINSIQSYSQLNRIRPKIQEIIRRINRVIIALEMCDDSKVVKEATAVSKKILKLAEDAKTSSSLLMINTNMERIKAIV